MTPFVLSITTFLSVLTIIADVIIIIVFIVLGMAWLGDKNSQKLLKKIAPHALVVAFIISLSVFGSLFYSQIAGFTPCELCWWARIFLFPQPIILLIALWFSCKDSSEIKRIITNFALTVSLVLSSIGALINIYHAYGQLVNPDVLPDCSATGISCAKLYFVMFGYVSIPTMSLTAFLLLIVTALIYKVGKVR